MKGFILFSLGVITGFAGGYFFCKKKYDTTVQNMHEDVEYYSNKVTDLKNKLNDLEEKEESKSEKIPGENFEENKAEKEEEDMIYDKVKEPIIIEHEDINIEKDYEQTQYELDEEAFDWHQANKDKPCKVINADQAGDLPAYIDTDTLYYYAIDQVLVDDNDEEIEEPPRLIGHVLDDYEFELDQEIVFIMNYELDTCYEVMCFNRSFY